MESLDSFVDIGQEEAPANILEDVEPQEDEIFLNVAPLDDVLLDLTPLDDSLEIPSNYLEIPSRNVMQNSTASSDGLLVSTVSSDGGLVMLEDDEVTNEASDSCPTSDTETSSECDGVDGLTMMGGSMDRQQSVNSNYSSQSKDSITKSKLYIQSFKNITNQSYNSHSTVSGQLKGSQFRSLVWGVLLRVLPVDSEQWVDCLLSHRGQYDKLQEKYYTNMKDEATLDPAINNPLSQAQDSPWHQHFLDRELRKLIWQDVMRTFPEISFFQDQDVREDMVNLLFLYARVHPRVGYKQGMHEVLGPLYYVVTTDYTAFAKQSDNINELEESELEDGFPPVELFHECCKVKDTFFLFQALMESLGPWYITNKDGPGYGASYDGKPWSRPQDFGGGNKVVESLNYIHDVLLKRHDSVLYTRLEKLEIFPQIYGIRWLRLLFGREFCLSDTLLVWDAILSEGDDVSLADHLVVSLLVSVRDLLLKYDYPDAVQLLMKLPSNLCVSYIIGLALHLKDPLRFAKPTGSAFSPNSSSDSPYKDRKLVAKPSSKFKKISTSKINDRNSSDQVDRKPMKLVKLKSNCAQNHKELPDFTVLDIKNEEFEKIENNEKLPNKKIMKQMSNFESHSNSGSCDLKSEILSKIESVNKLLSLEDLRNKNEVFQSLNEVRKLCAKIPNDTKVGLKVEDTGRKLKRNTSIAMDVASYFKEE